jgi:hypothetical protein
MADDYKVIAVPFLFREGTSRAFGEGDVYRGLRAFNTQVVVGECWHLWTDFQRIVSPELAKHVVQWLRAGETVEFPNRYELAQVRPSFP